MTQNIQIKQPNLKILASSDNKTFGSFSYLQTFNTTDYGKDKKKNKDLVLFGSDNLLPYHIANLNRKNTINRAIINSKTRYSIGRGLVSENSILQNIINKCNAQYEKLNNVLKNVTYDYITNGNGYIEFVTNVNKSFVNIYHHDSTTVRLDNKGNALLSANWQAGKEEKKLPIYPKNKIEKATGTIRTMLHLKDYEQMFKYYGVASWIAALDVAAIGYKTDKWNLSRLDNSFKGSGVLVVGGDTSPDDEKKIQKEFKDKMTGEGSTGKIIMLNKEGEVSGTSFTEIGQNVTEGDWTSLHGQSRSDLIIAHEWYRSLAGIADNTGFDTNRIRNDYEIALNSWVLPFQENIVDELSKVFSDILGIKNFDMQFKNAHPVSIASQINVNKVLTKRQGLQQLGIEEDEVANIDLNTFIDNGNSAINK